MSDREMRKLLHEVMADIEEGRVARPTPRRRFRLMPWLAPPLLAATLGLGLAACDDTAVGSSTDANTTDAALDATVDALPAPDAAYMAPFDAAMDTGVTPPYMAPPFDAGPDPDYASPFDATVDDAGNMPLYMGPPPQDD